MPTELLIQVATGDQESAMEHRVTHLPCSIGSSSGNDIQIPSAYVSRQHARLERREGVVLLLDLGTSNGTFILPGPASEGRRLVPKVPEVLSPPTYVTLGPAGFGVSLEIRFELEASSALPSLPPLEPIAPEPSARPAPTPHQPTPHQPTAASPNGAPQVSITEIFDRVPEPGAAVSAPPASRRGPAAARSAEPERPLQSGGSVERSLEKVALQTLESLAAHLTPGQALTSTADIQRLGKQLVGLTRRVSAEVVEVRKGYQSFRRAAGLGAAQASGHSAPCDDTAETLAAALVDFTAGAAASGEVVGPALRELAVHQVALVDGLKAGVEAVLQELDPERLKQEVRSAGHPLDRLLLRRRLWAAFESHHQALSDAGPQADTALARLLGPEFAKAYRAYRDAAR